MSWKGHSISQRVWMDDFEKAHGYAPIPHVKPGTSIDDILAGQQQPKKRKRLNDRQRRDLKTWVQTVIGVGLVLLAIRFDFPFSLL